MRGWPDDLRAASRWRFVFDLLVIAVYFGGDILSTMLNKLRRKPKQDDPFDFSLDTVTVSLSIDSIRQLYSGDAADFVEEKILPNAEKTLGKLRLPLVEISEGAKAKLIESMHAIGLKTV